MSLRIDDMREAYMRQVERFAEDLDGRTKALMGIAYERGLQDGERSYKEWLESIGVLNEQNQEPPHG